VPNGGSSGNVVVTVSGMASNGMSFTVFATAGPTITSLMPSSGPVETEVKIQGLFFGATQGTSMVTFNGTPANDVLSWSNTLILVDVPGAATSGPVVITEGTLLSNGPIFLVTSSSGSAGQNTAQSIGNYGFDVQGAQDLSTMETGWNYSPFYDVGAYIGGANYQGSQLPNNWVATVTDYGWGVMPIWVGRQPPLPYTICGKCAFYTDSTGTTDGQNDAISAAQAAIALGMPDSIIFANIEQYNPPSNRGSAACTGVGLQSVQNYVGAWVSTLHQYGFLAGIYFSASNCQDINIPGPNTPDAVYVGSGTYYSAPYSAAALAYAEGGPLYGLSPVSDTAWPTARVHQFFENV